MPTSYRSSRYPLKLTLAAGVLALICVAPAPAATDPGSGTSTPRTEKQSPYAAATDAPAPATGPIGGTKAPGSKKSSPYAAAKDSPLLASPTLGRLWGLLLPVVLAAASYGFLRSKEGNELA